MLIDSLLTDISYRVTYCQYMNILLTVGMWVIFLMLIFGKKQPK